MKVEKIKKAFEPVTITLETVEEFGAIYRILNWCIWKNNWTYQILDEDRDYLEKLYANLKEFR